MLSEMKYPDPSEIKPIKNNIGELFGSFSPSLPLFSNLIGLAKVTCKAFYWTNNNSIYWYFLYCLYL